MLSLFSGLRKERCFAVQEASFCSFNLLKLFSSCLLHTRDYAKFICVMSLLPSDSVPCFWCHFNPEALLFLQMLFLDVTTPILFLCLNIYEKCFAQDMTCMEKQKEFKKEFVKKKKKKYYVSLLNGYVEHSCTIRASKASSACPKQSRCACQLKPTNMQAVSLLASQKHSVPALPVSCFLPAFKLLPSRIS